MIVYSGDEKTTEKKEKTQKEKQEKTTREKQDKTTQEVEKITTEKQVKEEKTTKEKKKKEKKTTEYKGKETPDKKPDINIEMREDTEVIHIHWDFPGIDYIEVDGERYPNCSDGGSSDFYLLNNTGTNRLSIDATMKKKNYHQEFDITDLR